MEGYWKFQRGGGPINLNFSKGWEVPNQNQVCGEYGYVLERHIITLKQKFEQIKYVI